MSHFQAASWVGIWTLPSFLFNEWKQGDHLRHFSIFIKLCLSLFFVRINSGLCLSSCGPALEYRFKHWRHSSFSTRSFPKSLALRACSVLSKRNPLVFALSTPDFLLPPHWLPRPGIMPSLSVGPSPRFGSHPPSQSSLYVFCGTGSGLGKWVMNVFTYVVEGEKIEWIIGFWTNRLIMQTQDTKHEIKVNGLCIT